jgi:hypothetical protein
MSLWCLLPPILARAATPVPVSLAPAPPIPSPPAVALAAGQPRGGLGHSVRDELRQRLGGVANAQGDDLKDARKGPRGPVGQVSSASDQGEGAGQSSV